MKKGPSLEGLIVRVLGTRTFVFRERASGWVIDPSWIGSNVVGILLEDIPVQYGKRWNKIRWPEFVGMNKVEELAFFAYDNNWYRLDSHLKNRPSKVICNTVSLF